MTISDGHVFIDANGNRRTARMQIKSKINVVAESRELFQRLPPDDIEYLGAGEEGVVFFAMIMMRRSLYAEGVHARR